MCLCVYVWGRGGGGGKQKSTLNSLCLVSFLERGKLINFVGKGIHDVYTTLMKHEVKFERRLSVVFDPLRKRISPTV